MIDDWRTSRRIACMDAWEERAYLRILMECWDSPDGWIQADDEMLAVVTRCGSRWGKCKGKVLACFELNNGMLSHPKLQELRAEADSVSDSRKRSATSRWQSSEQSVTRSQRLRDAREKGRHTKQEWEALMLFCGGRCTKCGSDGVDRGGIVKDHVTPVYQGGSDGIDNIQPLCGTCNASKGPDRTDYLASRRGEFERLQMHCTTPADCRRSTLADDCYPQSQSQSQVKEKQEAQQQAAQAPGEPSRFAFACQYFQVSERLDADMATAFPWVDRQGEYRRMQAWCGANPTRAPRRQHGRFVHNWLAKCQPPKGTSDGKSLFERNRDNAQEALELLRQRRAAAAGGGNG